MRARITFSRFILLGICLLFGVNSAHAGLLFSTYANVTDPVRLSFGPSGQLYLGRDNFGSGGGFGDAVRIHRVGVGGTPVVQYGNQAIPDPDAVLFDPIGLISGQAGSVLVGGTNVSGQGQIVAIRPDQSVVTVFGPSSTYINPGDLAFDSTGRFVFLDSDPMKRNILTSNGGTPSILATLPEGAATAGLAIGPNDRIYVSAIDGVLRVYNPNGTLFNGAFATGIVGPIAFAPGGMFGTDLYSVNNNTGQVLRIDSAGTVSVLETGLPTIFGMTFGPDGAMYLSDFNNDRILRATPTAVPEPGALALLGSGVLALAVFTHRRRNHSPCQVTERNTYRS
jgi:hypothetical protein